MNLTIRLWWEILKVFTEPLWLPFLTFILSLYAIPKKLYWVFKVHRLRKAQEK